MFGLDSLPVVGGLFDSNSNDAMDEYKKALAAYQNLNMPNAAYQNYAPENYSYGGDFNPEAAQYQTVSEDPRLLSDQSAYLNQLKAMAAEGLSPEDTAVFNKAQTDSSQQARGANEAVMHNMQARGTADSGMELLSREMANQQGASRSQQAMLDQASTSAKQRALYEQAYGSEMGNERAADEKVAASNSDIINRFNQLNTGARNTATLGNIQNRQAVTNANIGARNDAQYKNQTGARSWAQTGYQDGLSKAQGLSNQYQNVGKADDAQADANAKKRAGLGAAVGSMFGPAGGAVGGALGNLF